MKNFYVFTILYIYCTGLLSASLSSEALTGLIKAKDLYRVKAHVTLEFVPSASSNGIYRHTLHQLDSNSDIKVFVKSTKSSYRHLKNAGEIFDSVDPNFIVCVIQNASSYPCLSSFKRFENK